jgi:Fe(3+) dicitrate transport protein
MTGILSGVVVDAYGEPIPGANVVLDGTSIGSATDAQGLYLLANVRPGAYVVASSAVGYRTERRSAVVRGGGVTVVDFALAEQTVDMGEVVVTARETLTRGPAGVRDLPGSAHYIGPEQLRAHADTDILRVLREVPGVNLQEEDGYGLRPNIGLRGTGSERSSKITLMEDGVLIAPAPYAAPAAYYFPTLGRMAGVEVRKGASQIKYGPYTTGGALNLLSMPIPSEFSGYAEGFIGQNEARNAHVHVGNAYRNVGFLLQTYQSNAAGFKEIFPLDDLDTGYQKQDYLAKLRVNTSPGASVYQSLTLKLTRTAEVSDETYLGLTAEDFAVTPFRRYAASQTDRMDVRHGQVQLRHVAVFSDRFDLTTTAYRNTLFRNWYKLDGVRAPGAAKVGLGTVLDDPAGRPAELALLQGAIGTNGSLADGRLFAKANNREYLSTGIQTVAGLRLDLPVATTEIEVGLRWHRDEMDRFQWEDQYAMHEGRMNRVVAGIPGTESNRIERGEALAAFAQAEVGLGRLTLTPGLRYEHITLSRDDYGRNDPERTGTDFTALSNTVDVWIPGLAARYALTPAFDVFAGLHRGFAPPTAQEGVRPEGSVNLELGVRYDTPVLAGQATVFYNDYDNLLGSDLAAGGGTGSTDQFNGGAVRVIGAELSASADLAPVLGAAGLRLPARLAYTYTDAAFQSSFQSTFGPWGSVEAGDELPYVARHVVATSLGLEVGRYGLDLRAAYTGDRRTRAGSGPLTDTDRLPAHFVIDLAADVAVDARTEVFGLVRNVFDEVYVAAQRPAGLRPGLPRTFMLGVRTSF